MNRARHAKRAAKGMSPRLATGLLAGFLVVSCALLVALGSSANAADGTGPTGGSVERVADASTVNNYVDMLGTPADGGRYSGRVWTDKSVYSGSEANIDGQTFTNDSDFLTVFSAMGSSRVVNGEASVPLDVVLMLDISTSMSTAQAGKGPIAELTREANTLIDNIMTMSGDNRVGVVSYGGGDYTVMPLDHYTADGKVKVGGKSVPAYLRLEQQKGSTGKDAKYFNRLKSTATGKRSGKLNSTQPYFFADSTYLQGALYEGTQMLVNETETTYKDAQGNDKSRIPVIVVLSDGGTNIVGATQTGDQVTKRPKKIDTSLNWWEPFKGTIPQDGGNLWAAPNGNPFYASVSSNKFNYNEAIAPRTLAVLLGAGRQKMQVEDHYKTSMRGYSIGYNISGLGRNELEQLYGTLDPGNYFNATSTAPGGDPDKDAYEQNRKAYETYQKYQQGKSPTMKWALKDGDKPATWVGTSNSRPRGSSTTPPISTRSTKRTSTTSTSSTTPARAPWAPSSRTSTPSSAAWRSTRSRRVGAPTRAASPTPTPSASTWRSNPSRACASLA